MTVNRSLSTLSFALELERPTALEASDGEPYQNKKPNPQISGLISA
jgi:hypothetical protein